HSDQLDLPSFPTRRSSDLSPTVVPRSAMVNTLEPPLRREFTSPRNCRTVRSLKDDLGLKFVRMRSPKRIPEAPGRSPASEKSTLDRKSTRLNSSHVAISYA